jgi:flagellar motility protein MotE (MotC chaperone)
MKNFLILGLLALLLFSVSAALSLWLNQSRTAPDPAAEKDKAAAKTRAPEGKDPPEPRPLPKVEPTPDASALLTDREARLARRSAQVELVMRDIQSQREAVEATLRQVNAELKAAAARTGDLDAVAADLRRKTTEYEGTEAKNIDLMAARLEPMPPESAAPILRQMAESGQMATAVKVLAKMKERQAARVLAELGDPALAAQILDKMRGLKTAPPPNPVVPVPGVPPLPAPPAPPVP